jgi:hypothetical protein
MISAYIYDRTPLSPLPCFFLDGGVWVCASFVFYSYALEVFVEIRVRAMPLKFTEHNYDMRCLSLSLFLFISTCSKRLATIFSRLDHAVLILGS